MQKNLPKNRRSAGRRHGGGSSDRRDATMPDPDTVDQTDDSVLGDSPVNENLVDTEPEKCDRRAAG